MLRDYWTQLGSDPELRAALVAVLFVVVVIVALVLQDMRDARRTRIVTAAELKRDQHTGTRRRRLKILQARFGDRRKVS